MRKVAVVYRMERQCGHETEEQIPHDGDEAAHEIEAKAREDWVKDNPCLGCWAPALGKRVNMD